MFRRSLSRGVLSLAFTFASLTLGLHVLSVVAFDPGRPGRVLAAMLETDEGTELATEAISTQLRVLHPRLSPDRADALAAQVAADPALVDRLHDSGGSATRALDAVLTTLAQTAPRVAAVASRHRDATDDAEASAASALVPSVAEQASSGMRNRLGRTVRLGALAAAALAAGALLLGPGRPLLLRRCGRWAMASSATGLVAWLVLPDLVLPRLEGRWPVVVAAGLRATGAELVGLFAVLFVAGALTWLLGYAGRFATPVLHRSEVHPTVRREARRRAEERRRQRAVATAPAAPGGHPDAWVRDGGPFPPQSR